ncbi:hypothetical protein ACQ143_00375 [Microbacterium sp. MC2]
MAFAGDASIGGLPRVNLLPRREIERRAQMSLLRRWGWGLAAALLVVVLVTAGAFVLQAGASLRLAQENARTNALLSQVAALQPVRDKLTLESELADFRAQAMGADLTWSTVVATAEKALPDDVVLSGFSLTAGVLPFGDDPTLEVGAVGTLTLASDSTLDMVPYVRALRQQAGVLSTVTDGWTLQADGAGYLYTVSLGIDQSVYTGAFAEEDQ